MATGFADRCPMGANLCVRGLQEVNETMTRPPHRRGRGGLAGRISHVRLSPTSCTPRPPVEVPLTLASLERQRLLGTRLPAAEFPIGAPHARLFARKTEPARSPARGARPSGPGTRETDARRACGRRLPSRETGPRPRPRPGARPERRGPPVSGAGCPKGCGHPEESESPLPGGNGRPGLPPLAPSRGTAPPSRLTAIPVTGGACGRGQHSWELDPTGRSATDGRRGALRRRTAPRVPPGSEPDSRAGPRAGTGAGATAPRRTAAPGAACRRRGPGSGAGRSRPRGARPPGGRPRGPCGPRRSWSPSGSS